MAGLIKNFLRISVIAAVIPQLALSAQAPNPRGGNTAGSSVTRNVEAESNASVRRSATSVIARTTSLNSRANNRHSVVSRSAVSRSSTPATVSRSARKSEKVVSNKSGFSRSAKKLASFVRSATGFGSKKTSSGGVARAASSRATAVFNDVSKIGGGYGSCRDAYATCMDQFCANANDTYRRCFCSDRFTEFRDSAEAFDTALKMLADFQDNNLNAVDKTAAEVNAMYSASAGEAAIKRDTSASQQLLDSIGDVLSGKKKKTEAPKTMSSLGVLDLSGFASSNSGDIWGDNGGASLFGGSNDSGVDMTELEGKELYAQANSQCSEVIREACKGDALFNMAKSAYSIMITQDCNMYQKNIDAKKASVEETVRTAEKYLREARLEEYRAHNSQDVNECLNKVESAMLQPLACGENYNKCLDYSGLYINPTTGEPIYSKALFDLNNLIVLDGSADVVGANQPFSKFLDERKMFAETALDTCRDKADLVWSEFKRMAIIRIAQAQDEKIEEVKSSCVETMKECYDEQSGALASFDDTSAQATGALTAITTHDMCKDKVLACAALYGDPDGCVYVDKTKTLENNGSKKCGLTSLLNFVNTVDSVKVAEGCEKSLTDYATELCTPTTGEAEEGGHGYPWKCRLRGIGAWTDIVNPDEDYSKVDTTTLYGIFQMRARDFCGDELLNSGQNGNMNGPDTALKTSIANSQAIIEKIVEDIKDNLAIQAREECEKKDSEDGTKGINGVWIDNDLVGSLFASKIDTSSYNTEFYGRFYGGKYDSVNYGYGYCAANTTMTKCLAQNVDPDKSLAEYDAASGECKFKDDWYKEKCASIGGYMEGDTCYAPSPK